MKKRVLLIASDFFGYYKLISTELQNQGWDVVYLNDRPSTHSIMKILIRKFRFLLSSYLDSYYAQKIKAVGKVDLILIVKGEGLTASLLGKIKRESPGIPIHFYLWDGIGNSPGALENSKVVDQTYSFDLADCEKFGFKLLPLFYLKKPDQDSSSAQKKWDLTFIGSIHGDRPEVISKVKKQLSDQYRFFIFLYFPSKLILAFRKLFDKHLNIFKSEEISLVPLAKSVTDATFKGSKAVLDIHHKNQSGLTMRTLEVLSLGQKLVTTNESIKKYEFYNEKQILIIDRKNPIIDLNFFDIPADPEFVKKIANYELSEWVRTLTKV